MSCWAVPDDGLGLSPLSGGVPSLVLMGRAIPFHPVPSARGVVRNSSGPPVRFTKGDQSARPRVPSSSSHPLLDRLRLDQHFIDQISRDHPGGTPMPNRSIIGSETPSCAIDPEVSTHQKGYLENTVNQACQIILSRPQHPRINSPGAEC